MLGETDHFASVVATSSSASVTWQQDSSRPHRALLQSLPPLRLSSTPRSASARNPSFKVLTLSLATTPCGVSRTRCWLIPRHTIASTRALKKIRRPQFTLLVVGNTLDLMFKQREHFHVWVVAERVRQNGKPRLHQRKTASHHFSLQSIVIQLELPRFVV